MITLATPARRTEFDFVFCSTRAVPDYGLEAQTEFSVERKSHYGLGEIILAEQISNGALVLCAHVSTETTRHCLFLPSDERPTPTRLWLASRSVVEILGAVYECRGLRVLPPAGCLRI